MTTAVGSGEEIGLLSLFNSVFPCVIHLCIYQYVIQQEIMKGTVRQNGGGTSFPHKAFC